MKKVIYTCITGGYDEVPKHLITDSAWDYVLFTDSKDLIARGTVGHWSVRPLSYNELTNVKNARWHKINSHRLFPEYDYSLWVDGNVSINTSAVFDKLNEFISSDVRIAVPLHPTRSCVYQEADTIKRLKIDSNKIVNQEMRFLKRAGYPTNNGLSETCILFRRHNDACVVSVCDTWWQMLERYSKRDQLSFNYSVWKHGIDAVSFYPTAGAHHTSGDFSFFYKTTHNQDRIRTKYPYFIARMISIFIPSKKNRKNFMINHSKPKKAKL